MREGRKQKVRRQTKGSKRGDHVGQADKQNGTGVQGDEATKKNRRPDLPKRAGGGRFPRVPWTTCIGRAKDFFFWELSHTRHMEMGQDKELYSKM